MAISTVSELSDLAEMVGMANVRVKDGKAERPERSANRALAASHMSSLSSSELIQSRALEIMRVRYDGMPSSLMEGRAFSDSDFGSHVAGYNVNWERTARREEAGGLL